MTRRQLRYRYDRAVERARIEGIIVDQARDRRDYWQKIAENLKQRLESNKRGQLEFKDTEVL